jgi:hypothetical protein
MPFRPHVTTRREQVGHSHPHGSGRASAGFGHIAIYFEIELLCQLVTDCVNMYN